MGKKNEAARMLANLNGPWSNAACMGYCLMAMQQAGVPETMRRKVVGGPIEMADTCLAASWAREDVDSIQMAVNEEGLLQELSYNEHATDLYAFNYMSSIVGPAVLMAARGDELIGFAKSVAESICAEWEVPLEATGTGECFQTFNPD